MDAIHFHAEEVDFHLTDEPATQLWIQAAIQQHNFRLKQLNFIFCSDGYLHKINLDYLQHDTLTDIITFDQSEESGVIEGDIFISVERVEENASLLNVTFDEELHRVMIHGVLHLMGHEDKTDAQKQEMRKKEEACLSLRP